MKISKDEVQHVAKLARLGIDESETELFSTQLSHILTYFDALAEMDTQGRSSSAAAPMHNVLREDMLEDSLPRERALMNAPEADEGHFQVPKMMD
ncbi:MAG: Asp-tRNA(Asn)/Glu-tRNA(Gln) amidotransferase GatCAB subunit C [Nitrospiraceae bacterium]|nr:Asp-tRNA(Asn)/Glu-tRNA(Gln) amidotransferase GatCAB subunit C [Nitrospiraceae bacterium]|tara:strand:- start:1045 stop:1329 length:285 start_codon:yes stop_codon:yes gene_type:complete